ncbi:MAG: hydrogenase 4 subunit B [Propionivibrio sp.]|uniref:hydrogenase 4 subunit B n=1 Tax=Propionivibrio sp. TaxID=2212460 RepID=UPI001A3A0896|nr:hydrogenase 4 subunit B [Propionivibrio sp.]MBL8416221.1 hydrogenase 4 subunit B [Propionivibrio sp.]
MHEFLLIDWVLTTALVWLLIGLIGVVFQHNFTLISRVLFPLGAVCGLALAGLALSGIDGSPQVLVLPIGLPDLPFHLRLDALSSFFLLLLGATAAGISIYAAGYIRKGEGTAPGLQCLLYHLFLTSMAFVLLADDGYAFMVAWETMALSSFFLVTSEHRHDEIRRAGYLYLLVAHVGAVGILLSFGVMAGSAGDYTFDAMRDFPTLGIWPTIAFLLALFGFGAKAGLLPLHVWLPEAHPAAPSPVSAMMSGVMLKTAIYGLLRVSFDLLHAQLWWWGALLLLLGLASAIFGAIFSTVQTDMKRLLAYSSIENIGLIFVGFGLTLIFQSFAMPQLAALALVATLYHCLNHAFFKSLLFLCTGSVLHATRERNLGKLGGLIHRMPWVTWLALVGVLASAGLPPLNGFVSEWLLLQSFLFTSGLPQGYLNMLLPLVAGAIALIAALAGFAMVKFFGVVFLGQPREEKLAQAHDAGRLERIGLLWLAAGCLLLGLLPNVVITLLDPVTRQLVGSGLSFAASSHGWWLLAPISEDRASYSPAIFLGSIVVLMPLVYWVVNRRFRRRLKRVPPWDCGFPLQTSRMQDTAEGFGQPIRRIFSPFFKRTREHPSPFDTQPRYRSLVEDPFWYWLYLPIARIVGYGTRIIAFLQQGRIAIYLLYSFVTLIALLVWTRG